jgi:hypothetical protein
MISSLYETYKQMILQLIADFNKLAKNIKKSVLVLFGKSISQTKKNAIMFYVPELTTQQNMLLDFDLSLQTQSLYDTPLKFELQRLN